MKIQEVIENLINGNVSDARKEAKRYGFETIRRAGLDLGMSKLKSQAMAYFLKTGEAWQRYCDLD